MTDVTETELNGLIDVTDMPLRQLWELADDTVLANALCRVMAGAGEQPTQVSAFNSAI